jgi:hypothetical protein
VLHLEWAPLYPQHDTLADVATRMRMHAGEHAPQALRELQAHVTRQQRQAGSTRGLGPPTDGSNWSVDAAGVDALVDAELRRQVAQRLPWLRDPRLVAWLDSDWAAAQERRQKRLASGKEEAPSAADAARAAEARIPEGRRPVLSVPWPVPEPPPPGSTRASWAPHHSPTKDGRGAGAQTAERRVVYLPCLAAGQLAGAEPLQVVRRYCSNGSLTAL